MTTLEEGTTVSPNPHQAYAQGEGSRDGLEPPQQSATGALPEDEEVKVSLSTIQEQKLHQLYETAAASSLIGHIHGRNPGLRGLQAWCKENLHESLTEISMLGRGFFELEFSAPEGKQATLGQSFMGIAGLEVSFSPWIPHFSLGSLAATRELRHPIWIQMLGLNRYLRQEEFLRKLASQLGEVILVEDTESYKGKTAGPRIRALVQDPTSLPPFITLIGTDGSIKQKIKVLYTGLPNQCNRCRGIGHYAKECKQIKNTTQAGQQKAQPGHKEITGEDKWQKQQSLHQRSVNDPRSRKPSAYPEKTQQP